MHDNSVLGSECKVAHYSSVPLDARINVCHSSLIAAGGTQVAQGTLGARCHKCSVMMCQRRDDICLLQHEAQLLVAQAQSRPGFSSPTPYTADVHAQSCCTLLMLIVDSMQTKHHTDCTNRCTLLIWLCISEALLLRNRAQRCCGLLSYCLPEPVLHPDCPHRIDCSEGHHTISSSKHQLSKE